MFDYIKTLLKKSDDVILHIGTNDSVNNPSDNIIW